MHTAPEIKTVLIPVDGSDHARKAALVGAAIAAKFGARIVLLHVLLRDISYTKLTELARSIKIPGEVLDKYKPVTPAVYDFGLSIPTGVISPIASTGLLMEIGQKILEIEKHVVEGQGVEQVDSIIEDDDAAGKIIELCKKEEIDFVVMGRRGLGGLSGMLSGSVSTKVGQVAPATVVSVT